MSEILSRQKKNGRKPNERELSKKNAKPSKLKKLRKNVVKRKRKPDDDQFKLALQFKQPNISINFVLKHGCLKNIVNKNILHIQVTVFLLRYLILAI
jgi:hypothetical protein